MIHEDVRAGLVLVLGRPRPPRRVAYSAGVAFNVSFRRDGRSPMRPRLTVCAVGRRRPAGRVSR